LGRESNFQFKLLNNKMFLTNAHHFITQESFGAGSVEEDRGASVQFNGSEKTSARLKEDIDDLGISLQVCC